MRELPSFSSRSWRSGALIAFLGAFLAFSGGLAAGVDAGSVVSAHTGLWQAAGSALADQAGSLNPWANWQIILAFFLPLVLQLITSRIHERSGQAIAAFIVSILVTIVGMIISGELARGGIDVVTTPLKVLVAVIAFYKGFWNPLGMTPSTGEAARH